MHHLDEDEQFHDARPAISQSDLNLMRRRTIWVHGPEVCKPCKDLDICMWKTGHKEEVQIAKIQKLIEQDNAKNEKKLKAKVSSNSDMNLTSDLNLTHVIGHLQIGLNQNVFQVENQSESFVITISDSIGTVGW
jgi:hypothetical protein